jgi:hypothetical protein
MRPPGAGKMPLARALPSIVPRLTLREAGAARRHENSTA